MRQVKWNHPPLTVDQLVKISDQILLAGLPFLSTVPGITNSLINFTDAATDEEIERAISICEAYDAAAEEAAERAKKKARADDLRPFKQIDQMLQANTRDKASLKDAKLADMKDLLAAFYDREALILKALSRILEGQVVDEGDGT